MFKWARDISRKFPLKTQPNIDPKAIGSSLFPRITSPVPI